MKRFLAVVLAAVLVGTAAAAEHIRSDGHGGFWNSDGSHTRSDSHGGYWHSDGSHTRSDNHGGYWTAIREATGTAAIGCRTVLM